jgi:hypothetical protein
MGSPLGGLRPVLVVAVTENAEPSQLQGSTVIHHNLGDLRQCHKVVGPNVFQARRSKISVFGSSSPGETVWRRV